MTFFYHLQQPKKEGLALYSDKRCEVGDNREGYMALGYVLIITAPTHEHKVYRKLTKVSAIIELHPLFGEYDLIAKIEAEDFEKLGDIVVTKIRTIKGIVETKTLTGTKFS